MKMRKLFAGIAAAATLLGGMALGATSAQADGAGTIVTDTANFTFTAQDAKQLTNRSLNAYKIADYVQYTALVIMQRTVCRLPTVLTAVLLRRHLSLLLARLSLKPAI